MTLSEALFGWMYVNVLIIAGLLCVCAVLVGVNRQPKVAPFAPPVEFLPASWDAQMEPIDFVEQLMDEGDRKLAEDKARLGRTYPLPKNKRRAA